MVDSVDKKDDKKQLSFSAVLGSLLSGSGKVTGTHEVLNSFHTAGEFGDRSLPMKAVLKNPRGCELLEVNVAHCESVGFVRCAELRKRILDSTYRLSVGGDKGKWRELSEDAMKFGMVQEFEIKKRSKDKQLLGIS